LLNSAKNSHNSTSTLKIIRIKCILRYVYWIILFLIYLKLWFFSNDSYNRIISVNIIYIMVLICKKIISKITIVYANIACILKVQSILNRVKSFRYIYLGYWYISNTIKLKYRTVCKLSLKIWDWLAVNILSL
jgi:hypothetical protein